MDEPRHGNISRRRLLTLAGATAAGLAASGKLVSPASAHHLEPTEAAFRFNEYEAIVNREVRLRQVYEWPNLANSIIFANTRNGINAAVFSYGVPEDQIQVVVAAYASASAATYDDFIWAKYRLGEAMGVKDPATGQPAARNIWYPSANPRPATRPSARTDPYYADTSMEGLQRRGVLFITCHQSVHALAGAAFAGGRNPDNLTADQITEEIGAHLVPGAIMTPGAVLELVRLQDKGYRLVVNH
jgi:intracellular sulfur oxidation DsrE/DsrF family protein